MAVLNNSAGEDLGDQDALEAELEQELAAAEEAAEAEGGGATSRPTPQSKKVVHSCISSSRSCSGPSRLFPRHCCCICDFFAGQARGHTHRR